MKVDDLYPSRWLKASDLEGQPRLATIEVFTLEEVEQGKPRKPVLRLRGIEAGFVLNKVNGRTLAEFLGDETDAWIGKQIVLYPAKVDYAGQLVDAIRCRAPRQRPQATNTPPKTPQALPPAQPDDVAF